MIQLKQISYSIDNKDLFSNISFTIQKTSKIGLLGINGAGKSSLIKIIAGIIQPSSGEVIYQKEQIGYLPQEINYEKYETIESFMNTNPSGLAKKYLGKVGLGELSLYDFVQDLSGGQKLRLGLANVLSLNPSILLLDEPTNHLDDDGKIWLADFLNNFNGGYIMISHDRFFLNNTVNSIIEIDKVNQEIQIYSGNYDDYKQEKQIRFNAKMRQYNEQQKQKKKMEEWIVLKRQEASVYVDPAKGKQLRQMERRLQREVLDNELVRPNQDKAIKSSKLMGDVNNQKLLMRVNDLNYSFDDKRLFFHLNFEIRGGERVLLKGKNGAGKTTLLKILTNQISLDSSEIIEIGPAVKIGYISQMQSELKKELSILEMIKQIYPDLNESRARSILGRFLFKGDDCFKKIEILSYGERMRFLFALLLQSDYQLLILDEPTNHLDIQTRELIEDLLKDYQGSLLIVSHDEYFCEQINWTHEMIIEGGEVKKINL